MRLSPLVLLLFLFTASLSAFATLGGSPENENSVTPQTQSRAQIRSAISNGYSIHTIISESGVAVREYVSMQGTVFAIAWNGPFLPNLEHLLGAYFPSFSAAASARRAAGIRGPIDIKQDDLVVQSSGHMRSYRGRAYVPSLIPPQVSIDEIQ